MYICALAVVIIHCVNVVQGVPGETEQTWDDKRTTRKLEECEDTSSWRISDKKLCWKLFKIKYNKVYRYRWREMWRKYIWEKNMEKIRRHNKVERTSSKKTFKMGMNSHGDRTDLEIQKYYLNGFDLQTRMDLTINKKWYNKWLKTNIPPTPTPTTTSSSGSKSLPSIWDWRSKGCNTTVGDQAPCGSCYIFAAAAVLECQWARKYNRTAERVSAQQVVDCGRRYGKKYHITGCHGGYSYHVLRYFQKGVPSEKCYPYTGRHGRCHTDCPIVAHTRNMAISRITDLNDPAQDPIDVNTIRKSLVNIGPVVSSMVVMHKNFRWYKSGIYSNKFCNRYASNHAVATVGYGPGYWLAKNSFGPSWGLGGYFKISSNPVENCNFHGSMLTLSIGDRKIS